jgi:hypothetical protein
MSRSFFRKAVALRDKPAKVRGHRRVSLKGNLVWTRTKVGTRYVHRYMTEAQARMKQGAQKMGRSPRAHRWTSEEARKAALKSWKKKGRKGPYTGRRLGRKLARAKAVDREPFRILHSDRWFLDYMYATAQKQWYKLRKDPYAWVQQVSERTALRNLGYLPKPSGHVPEEVHKVTRRGQ